MDTDFRRYDVIPAEAGIRYDKKYIHEYLMVKKWITERLRHKAQIALRLSEMPLKEVAAVLEEQLVSS